VKSGIVRTIAVAAVAALLGVTVASPAGAATPPRPHPHRKPWPITITIQTVPALPNIRFTVDGKTLTTDAHGKAAYTMEHNFQRHTLALVDASVDTADRRFRFARWAGQRDPNQAFRTTVTGLPMRANYTVTAAFTVLYPVNARFVDQNGSPLQLAQVSAVKIRDDDGNLLDLPTSGTVWLDGQAPTYHKSALQIQNVSYSLQTVMVDGTNVVDAGKQRFQPAVATNPTFVTQFHDLTIKAHDALFGGAIGDAVRVTYPDGTVHTVPFGPDHTATLDNLPRGQYSVDVTAPGGVAFSQQLRLSRAGSLDIIVVSRGDQVTVVLALLLLAVGLLVVGRARIRRALVRQLRRGVHLLVRPARDREVSVA
jgi:hypothetical protein